MYDSWKSIMELYMMTRQHGRMILESVENGPLIWPSIEENGVTRPKKYSELSTTEAIQADCNSPQYSHTQSSTPLSITNPPNEFQSSVHHNVYTPSSSSIPQVEYAPSVNQQPEFSQPDSGLIFLVFKKGVDPINAINHMMSFLTVVVTSRYPLPTEITSDNNIIPYSWYVSESQQAVVQNSNSPAQQDALILFVIEQLKTQVINCTKINLDNKSVNDTLIVGLERYKDLVRILKEGQNVDLKSKEIDNLKQTLSAHLKEKESFMQTVTLLKNDFQKEESRNIDREIALEKHIKELNNIVFKRNQSAQTNFVNSLEPTPSTRPTQVEVPKELPKVSMAVKQHRVESKTFQDKMNKVLNENERDLEQVISKDVVNIVVNSSVNNAYEPVHECERCGKPKTGLQKKLKGRSIVDEAVISHPIDPEMLKVDVAPLAPKLQNNRTVHSDYLKHTQEETVTLREIVEHERLLNLLNNSLDYVVQIVLWYLDSDCSKYMIRDRSQLINFIDKFLGTVKFSNDYVAKITGYGDYQIGNVTILRVYFVDGLGHTLFSVGQLCDSYLEVAFREHTCFIHNLKGVDLLSSSQGNKLYTLSLGDMLKSSLICLFSKALKTKSWLWHRRLSHLNFGAINYLARQEGVATTCFIQNRSIIRLHHSKTPYELLHEKHPDLSYFYVFGALCYPTNDSENLGKRIIETIHVDFDELTAMASVQSSSGPTLHEMTPATISSGLVPKPTSSTPLVPPSRTDWDLLFQSLFDELLTPSSSVDHLSLEVIASIAEVVTPEPAESTVHAKDILMASMRAKGCWKVCVFEVLIILEDDSVELVSEGAIGLSEDIQVSGSDTRPPMLDKLILSHGNNEFGYTIREKIMECTYFSQLMKAHSRWDCAEMRLLELYDEFEHFEQHKGENIHEYYVRFVMAVKLNRGLKESNHDQLYAYLKQHELHANKNKMLMERLNQHSHDPLALVSNVSRGAAEDLDEEQLFLVGGQTNTFDDEVDEGPVQDMAQNEDNIFQADQCDAFDSNVDEAPTAQTMFMANLSSVDLISDEVGLLYDSDTLFEVYDHDNCLDNVNHSHEEHEIHNVVQPNDVVDSDTEYMSDS
nr:integrase, catalytic region, zinc finger, CCHC-type, peptidase aspartic, catalytic [Tanacetum cinerariifolium]